MSDRGSKAGNYLDDLKRFGLTPLELARIVPLDVAAGLASLSKDTIKRKHADKVVQLSTRRQGMHVGDALTLKSK